MHTPELPLELWIRVLRNLRRPVPEPRSNAPRGDMLQPDLCSGARVCKLFQTICQKLLFTHIATDFPQSVLPSTREAIPLRRHLFAHTVSFTFEYCDKSPHISYQYLLLQGGWSMIGMSEADSARSKMILCGAETKALAKCMETLDLDEGELGRALFPRLRSIAVGSIYGGQDELWGPYDQKYAASPHTTHDTPNPSPRLCTTHFHKFSLSSTARHICVRGIYGPLRMKSSPMASEDRPIKGTPPSLTVHFTPDTDTLPMYLGRKMRWVSDTPSTTSWNRSMALVQRMVGAALRHLDNYPEVRALRQQSDNINVTLYNSVTFDVDDARSVQVLGQLDDRISASRYKPNSPALMRARVAGLGESYKGYFRAATEFHEEFRWFPSADAGRCGGCGSTPPP